jgi:hypothetical protein
MRPEPKSPQSANKTEAQVPPERLPSVSVQSGVGHPAFKIADQSPKGDEIIAVVVPEKTSDEEIIKLLWYFRSMVAEHRWKDLGIYPPRVLPSGVTTGMFVIYKGEKCAQENDFEKNRDKEPPCGSGDHGAGFYQWGIPTDPTNDEAALTKDGHEQWVFASVDDHWKVSDQNAVVKEGLIVAKASGHPIINYRLIASNEKLSGPDEGLRYAVINKRPTDEELVDLGLELHKKYPSSKFRIVDSTSGIKDLDAFFDQPLKLKYPQAFASEHFFAMVNWWRQDGKWELIGWDAHPPSGEPIVALE